MTHKPFFFLFVQFEFTHALGPHAGRYVVESGADPVTTENRRLDPRLDTRNRELAGTSRGVGHSDVLVVGVVGAPTSGSRGLLRKARSIKGDNAPAPVPLTLVSFVNGRGALADQSAAAGQLDRIRYSEVEQEQWVKRGLEVLNLAIRAYRVGAPDPYAVEVTRRDARQVRIGYGSSDEVREGRFSEAIELPPAASRRPKRAERLKPSEAVAAVLVGRRKLFESEDLLVRSLIDLDHGRARVAALQIAGAMRLLSSEVGELDDPEGLDLGTLAERARDTERLADLAQESPLDAGQIAELETVVDEVRALLDTWRYRADASLYPSG
jgi:hypothetical protein